MFSVFGLFSIIFLWLTASVYLTAAVALGDFCIKPTPFIIHKLEGNRAALEKKYPPATRNTRAGPSPYPWISKDISKFYLECSPIANPGRQSPFQQQLNVSKRSTMNSAFNISTKIETRLIFSIPEHYYLIFAES